MICNGCGHENTRDTYCEMCGARLFVDDSAASFEEASLSLMLGLVCTTCDTYNDPGSSHCFSCGSALSPDGDDSVDTPAVSAAPTPAPSAVAAPSPAAPSPATPSPAAPSPAATPAPLPAWMSAPEGSPLATVNAMKAVDLGAIAKSSAAGLQAPTGIEEPSAPVASPPVASPSIASPSIAPPPAAVSIAMCPKCSEQVLADDIFCRHCGTNLHEAATAKTQVMSAVRVSPGLPSPSMTTAMPSVNIGATNASATMFFGAASVDKFARLLLLKGHTAFGTQWRLQAGETVVGRSFGAVFFPDDEHLASEHCRLVFDAGALWLHPTPSTNGVFVKIAGQVRVDDGDAFVIGQQHFTILPRDARSKVVNLPSDGTHLCSGALPATSNPIYLKRVGSQPFLDEVYLRTQRILTIGRSGCDLSFSADAYISTRHAQLLRDENELILEDLGSRNGTFLRINAPLKLKHGDQVMMGEQVLRVEIAGGL